MALSFSLSIVSSVSHSFFLSLACRVTTARCDAFFTSLLVPICVSPLSAVDALSLSLYLSFLSRLSLFLSLFLSLTDFSLCVCCLSCHHCDATVMVRCDIFLCLSFGHVSRLSAVGMLSVALFLSLSFSDSLSLSLAGRVTTSDATVMARCDVSPPLFWSPSVSLLFLLSTRCLSLFYVSLSFFLSLSLFSLSLSFLSLSPGTSQLVRTTAAGVKLRRRPAMQTLSNQTSE